MPPNIPEDQDFEDLFARQIPTMSTPSLERPDTGGTQHSRDASGNSGGSAALEVWDPPTNSLRPKKEHARDTNLMQIRDMYKDMPPRPGSPNFDINDDIIALQYHALNLDSTVTPMEPVPRPHIPKELRDAYNNPQTQAEQRAYYNKLLQTKTPPDAEMARSFGIGPRDYRMMKMRDTVRQTLPDSTFPFFNGNKMDDQIANFPEKTQDAFYNPPPTSVSQYIVVSFKHHRAEVFLQPQALEFTNALKLGDMVVVQADRGENVGQIWHICSTMAEAERVARNLNSDQLNNLLNFARTYVAQAKALSPLQSNYKAPPQPGWIIRRAEGRYLLDLQRKEHDETKAKRIAAQKAEDMGYPLEILDTEFQIDHQKLTIYYISSEYVRFKELVNNIYKIYKMRIWMSSINPQHPPEMSDAYWGPDGMEGPMMR